MTPAAELLRQYVQTGSEDAFAQLVKCYVDVVYSAARRQARGDTHLAEEITQQVFILLARKAKTLGPQVLISGWLYNTACFVARDVMRKEERRAYHQHKAAMMTPTRTPDPSDWSEAEAILDDAMSKLDSPTRDLLVERYFEGKSSLEVAQRLGITEEAARKRLNRAVDRLREMFVARGVVMSGAALADALALHSTVHAPAHLAASAASAAASSTIATGASIAKTGTTIMALAKSHVLAASIIGAIALGGAVTGGVNAVRYFSAVQPTNHGAIRTIRVAPAAPVVSGIVRDAGGQPVAGAEIRLSEQGKGINIYDKPAGMVRVTADDGTYAFNKPAGPFEVVILAPGGYAQISSETLEKSTDIRVVPWGRVEGRVLAGTTPLANVAIYAFETAAPYGRETVRRQTQTRTDSDGRFVFPRVAPGEIRLAQQDPATERFYRWTYSVADAGKTTMITIGGTGRAVVGRFANPSTTQPLLWDFKSKKFNPSTSFRQTDGPAFRRPEHQSNETLEEWRAVEEAFGRTPEGAEINRLVVGGWQFRVNPDGSFRIDDVPAGEYALDAGIMRMDFAEVIAQAATTVRVEPMPGDRSDKPLDIGSVPMTSIPHLHAGDAVTPFDITMLDGSIKNITDFGGKHLLVVFFSTAEGYKEGVEAFKRLAADYEANSRVQVLWLSISTPEEAAVWAERYGLSGIIASVASTDLPGEYDALQANGVLIDPAGKLVQKRMIPEQAKQQLRKTLGATTARK
jgi:RNA polymerase sigma factor (sigma-70 family)